MKLLQLSFSKALTSLMLVIGLVIALQVPALAVSHRTPWDQTQENSYQNLVYGSSSPLDVQRVMGRPPDEVVKGDQMFPVIENHYYYGDDGTGAATIFVFENGFLVALNLKTADDQIVDLTYFLQNNGDYNFNSRYNAGFWGYNPIYQLYNTPYGRVR